MHHILNFESDNGVLCTFEEGLGSFFLDLDNFFYHLRHFLLAYLKLVIFGVLLDFVNDLVINRVEIDLELANEIISDDGLKQELGTFIVDDVVPQV